ncbi:choline/glycine betaine transporter BetT [Psychroflexus gondwanensis ACAM 44]|jgi:choline/glycine/proline betaine transport protein|uniref:Choline/glycine betaine transporter BetT n=1 Tax=Psychroflexus gondwanensis ACAM 44 TaxID=1189619 RepID=N1WJW2_9FLAO|nr:BCCT family transporter [Psychroflexus gondwanensis]EMY80501.1 choline/glycine betaine transporter BetT [Psychroflexus gondwanensis ACAM 44]
MSEKVTRSDEKKSIFGLEVNGPVFFSSIILITIGIALTLIYKESAEEFFSTVQNQVAEYGGWLFVFSVNFFLIFVVYLAFSKFGKIRLGGKDAEPEFKTISWFSMLFSAGMGIGLLFWSVAEPVTHFGAPPNADADTIAAAKQAMNFTFLHWGFHPWAIYALVGLALAFFTYSRGLPLTIRSVFYPFLGDKIYGVIGDIIDIFAVLATLFGLATSLGFGVQQVAAGLEQVFGLSSGTTTQVLLIAGITLVATISVVLGVDKGVKVLSEWNIRIAVLLLALVLILGPTLFIFESYLENLGNYFSSVVEISLWNESFTGGDWQNNWTIFYWGWWISWSPFVGTFIARISKGRTIKEFILGVLIVPSLITFFWITAFGNSALDIIMNGNDAISTAVDNDVATALFVFFEDFPFTIALNVVAILLIIGFFITSSDSGSLVIDSLTTGGKIDAPVGQRIFWAITEGAVAAVLLIGGGLGALQTAAIASGLPFAIILLVMCYSLYKGLKDEVKKHERYKEDVQKEDYEEIVRKIIKKRNKNESS